jgi:hypothetical protein
LAELQRHRVLGIEPWRDEDGLIFVRVIVSACAPSFTLNRRPLLTLILPIVYRALLYQDLLERMADKRTFLLFQCASLVRSFVFAVIPVSGL